MWLYGSLWTTWTKLSITKGKTYGYVLTYVDGFLIIGPTSVRKAVEEEISMLWNIKVTGEVEQFDTQNPDASLTFLSTTIRSHPKIRWIHYESRGVYTRRFKDVGNVGV